MNEGVAHLTGTGVVMRGLVCDGGEGNGAGVVEMLLAVGLHFIINY